MPYLIGIDEAGRGPLAGPVAVGAVIVPSAFEWHLADGAKDSKQMTEKARETMYERLCTLREEGILDFAVAFSSASVIDKRGIAYAVSDALARALVKAGASPDISEIRLDGSLYAPAHFTDQKTIIRGDQTEPVISLASIAAKVERDRLMRELAVEYPIYGFDVHKGYGTAAHRAIIREAGLSPVHRATFCTRITSK